ncbi:DUF4180 domain-containing protein [Dyadobacter sp. CY107]|uniref:DUF4180 domain-containing protein n=1 Tax=Dyadobacter fanqingshengii TaxID=2906443 RepID=UPI001F1E4BF3|nr:DUF4180 domain-containing protein [Dyadobacter fanqingshengii]MCF2503727.1 DUF4180 domain-containing protein [Dyadobacter fanqingshengii]
MNIISHTMGEVQIGEVTSDKLIIETAEDGLDLLGNLYYQGFDSIIIHEENITPSFFDLKTGIAGEILQKFSNYRIRLAIIGNFEKYPGKSIQDFITESNRSGRVNFVSSVSEALERLSRRH